MTRSPVDQATVIPEIESRGIYQDLARLLSQKDVRLTSPGGPDLPIPQDMRALLRAVAQALASNTAVIVTTANKNLTTQQAADLLGVSRPSLVRLLEESHAIPFTWAGAHRRVNITDLLAYRQREYHRQRQAMTELTQIGEEIGGYDTLEGDATLAAQR